MRNKNKFIELNERHIIHCNCCGRDLFKNSFTYRDVQENCNIGTCRYCSWLKRHKNIVPEIENWTESEVKLLVDFIMNDKSIYLNDVLPMFKDKSLKDLCKASTILHTCKPSKVKVSCEYCGKEIEEFPNVYYNNTNTYCSHDCYYKDKTNKLPKGKDSPFYNRITTNCSYCGKKIEVIPYNFNIKNEFGESDNFCSQKCYYSFRSVYYTGEKCPAYGREMTDELKNKMRQASLKKMKSEDRLNSKIQLIINDILSKNNIKYEREYFVDYYSVDNYLPEYNLMIEVMGNYWHASPIRYNENKYLMNEKQKGWISNDKRKKSYIYNHFKINILYLWETDINSNPEKCEKLILEYIKRNGILNNYHSFNYYLDEENNLRLNNVLTVPYQDKELNTYKHLFKAS